MAFITTIEPQRATGSVLSMYERQEQSWGYVPNYARVFSHRPELMARWGRMLAEIKRPVDAKRFELVTFVTAIELRNRSCALAHGKILAELIGEATVAAIAKGDEAGVLSESDCAMIRFARQVARDASQVQEADVNALISHHGFTDREIFDITAIAAGRAFFTKILDALGSEPDSKLLEIDKACPGIVPT